MRVTRLIALAFVIIHLELVQPHFQSLGCGFEESPTAVEHFNFRAFQIAGTNVLGEKSRKGRAAYISGLERFIHFQRSAGSLGSSALVAFARFALGTPLSVDLRFLPIVRVGIEADSEETLAGWAFGA